MKTLSTHSLPTNGAGPSPNVKDNFLHPNGVEDEVILHGPEHHLRQVQPDPSSPEMGPATTGIISKHRDAIDVVGGQLGLSASVEPVSRSMCNKRVILRGYKLA